MLLPFPLAFTPPLSNLILRILRINKIYSHDSFFQFVIKGCNHLNLMFYLVIVYLKGNLIAQYLIPVVQSIQKRQFLTVQVILFQGRSVLTDRGRLLGPSLRISAWCHRFFYSSEVPLRRIDVILI